MIAHYVCHYFAVIKYLLVRPSSEYILIASEIEMVTDQLLSYGLTGLLSLFSTGSTSTELVVLILFQ